MTATTRVLGFSICDCTDGTHDLKTWPGVGRSKLRVDTEREGVEMLFYSPGCHLVRVTELVEAVDMAEVDA